MNEWTITQVIGFNFFLVIAIVSVCGLIASLPVYLSTAKLNKLNKKIQDALVAHSNHEISTYEWYEILGERYGKEYKKTLYNQLEVMRKTNPRLYERYYSPVKDDVL